LKRNISCELSKKVQINISISEFFLIGSVNIKSDYKMGSEEEYILKWNDHKNNFFSLMAEDLFQQVAILTIYSDVGPKYSCA